MLLTSYLAETFEASVDHGRDRGMRVEVTHEETPLGTAGAIKNAEAFIGDETFFAFNGDVLTDMDLGAMLDFHRVNEAETTIVLTPVEDPSAYGVVPTDEMGRVIGFIEKPPRDEAPTNLINAGVYIMEPSVLDRIPAGVEHSAERALFPGLVEEGARIFATGTDAYWMDIGTPRKYLQANLDALSGRFRCDAVSSPGAGCTVIDPSATVDGTAAVADGCVGANVTVGAEVRIERSVLLPGVDVGRGAHIVDSVLGEDCVVGAGVRLDGETLGDGSTV